MQGAWCSWNSSGGGPCGPGEYYDNVATATPVFGSADENILIGVAMSGTGTVACCSSSVVVHDSVLRYSCACVEHAQVQRGEARVERGHNAL